MKDVTINIHEIHQVTGAHEHIVDFDAHIVFSADDLTIKVELVSLNPMTFPTDAEPELVEIALNGIRDGVRTVLAPKGYGAIVQVSNLTITPTDFQGKMFEVYTITYLEKALRSLT